MSSRQIPKGRSRVPSLRVERSILREFGGYLLAADEVGRGSCAGPVTCGVVIIDKDTPPLRGIRDSKDLTPRRRTLFVEPIHNWCVAWGVGHASPGEIDELGLTAALRLAVHRAAGEAGLEPSAVLIDGNVDWYSLDAPQGKSHEPPVFTRVKADNSCTAVAAASVLAKESRDELMVELGRQRPEYGWEVNKGYLTELHQRAIREHGLTRQHRNSWNIPK